MPSVLLIDDAQLPGRGVAYGTSQMEHLLNVPASGMSILPDNPDHFIEWLRLRGESNPGLGERFMARAVYGGYLHEQLEAAQIDGVRLHRSRVVALGVSDGYRLTLADGSRVDAANVVLAIGNSPHRLPVPHEGVEVIDAWDDVAVAAIPAQNDVAIVGAGLSMVDAVLSLAVNNHLGRIDVFSRHGLAPLPHDGHHDSADFDINAFVTLPLRSRVDHLRRWIDEHPQRHWQAMMRALRSPGQRLWQSLGYDEQERFLRHVVRFWDIHRHRIAPQVAETIAALRTTGQLTLHAGRPRELKPVDGRVEVSYLPRHAPALESLTFDCVINATGLETHLESSSNPLLQSLLANGQARPGPHGRGLDTAADGSVLDRDGAAQPNLYTLGSSRIGSLWESIAIPDLRVHAADVAALLLRAAPVSTREGVRD